MSDKKPPVTPSTVQKEEENEFFICKTMNEWMEQWAKDAAEGKPVPAIYGRYTSDGSTTGTE